MFQNKPLLLISSSFTFLAFDLRFPIEGQSHGELAEPLIMREKVGAELDEAPKYITKLF